MIRSSIILVQVNKNKNKIKNQILCSHHHIIKIHQQSVDKNYKECELLHKVLLHILIVMIFVTSVYYKYYILEPFAPISPISILKIARIRNIKVRRTDLSFVIIFNSL